MKTTSRMPTAAVLVLAEVAIVVCMTLSAVAMLSWPQPALADDSGSCYAISDGDARTFCLARAHKDPGRCYSIQESGLRSQCLAEIRSERQHPVLAY